MAQVDTYGVTTIREDLHDAITSISPTETPFMTSAGKERSVSNTLFEWPVVSLAAASGSNRVIEGETAPAIDTSTLPVRLSNYTQISDKVVEVSSTAEAVDGAGDAQKMAKQITFKLRELKRDMETMLCSTTPASAGSSGASARATAGFLAFLRTNTDRGAGAGADPTLSGTTSGYPDVGPVAGTDRAADEDDLSTVIAACWDAGADPSMVLVNSALKQKISTTFTGVATRYKDAADKKVVAAIDVYVSDFGELQIVPSRFVVAKNIYIIDPNYYRMGWLIKTAQKPLAETGHAKNRLIYNEYGLIVDTDAAHGVVADVDPAL